MKYFYHYRFLPLHSFPRHKFKSEQIPFLFIPNSSSHRLSILNEYKYSRWCGLTLSANDFTPSLNEIASSRIN